mgnify:CR=1 FL=1
MIVVDGVASGGPGSSPRLATEWVRYNDYGIGLFLKGKSELRQSGVAFAEVETLGRFDGPLNLARVLFREGRLNEAAEALARASRHTDPAPPAWTIAWLSGLVARDLNQLEKAETMSAPPASTQLRSAASSVLSSSSIVCRPPST